MKTGRIKNWIFLSVIAAALMLTGCSSTTTSNIGARNQVSPPSSNNNSGNNQPSGSSSGPTNAGSSGAIGSGGSANSGGAANSGGSANLGGGGSGNTGAEMEQPVSIAFWNTQQGLLVTSTNAQASIWKTADGGQNWTKVYEYRNQLSRVVVTGDSSAKVLTGINWTTPSSQLVTTNNGQTWEEQAYQQPSFAQTACGGDTFVNHSAPTSAQIWALCDGQPGAGQMQKRIVFSADVGKTWTTRADVNLMNGNSSGLSGSGYPAGIDFLASGRGWLWESRGYSYYTTDGGQHWTPFTGLTQPESKEGRSMSLIDDQHGYALIWDNAVYRLLFTADSGQSWTEVKSWKTQ